MADMPLQYCINSGGSTFKMEDCGGGQRLCSNYRGITLTLPATVYATVLEKRFCLLVEPVFRRSNVVLVLTVEDSDGSTPSQAY